MIDIHKIRYWFLCGNEGNTLIVGPFDTPETCASLAALECPENTNGHVMMIESYAMMAKHFKKELTYTLTKIKMGDLTVIEWQQYHSKSGFNNNVYGDRDYFTEYVNDRLFLNSL